MSGPTKGCGQDTATGRDIKLTPSISTEQLLLLSPWRHLYNSDFRQERARPGHCQVLRQNTLKRMLLCAELLRSTGHTGVCTIHSFKQSCYD